MAQHFGDLGDRVVAAFGLDEQCSKLGSRVVAGTVTEQLSRAGPHLPLALLQFDSGRHGRNPAGEVELRPRRRELGLGRELGSKIRVAVPTGDFEEVRRVRVETGICERDQLVGHGFVVARQRRGALPAFRFEQHGLGLDDDAMTLLDAHARVIGYAA